MKVSKIELQQKNKDRYSIYLNDEYSFSLNSSQLIASKLSVGQELTKEDVKRFQGESEAGKLFDRTIRWFAIRPRSEWEIDEYLKRIRYKTAPKEPDTKIDLSIEVKNRLKKLGFIDDRDFAKRWVANRRALKHMSKKKLKLELLQKRISKDLVDEVLSGDETSDTDTLKSLIEKKRQLDKYKDNQKLMSYLARQGFNYSDIKQAIDELS